MRYAAVLLALMLSGLAVAAAPSDRPPDLKPVPGGVPGAEDEASVTIKPSSQGRVVEYRANGKLYMLKITPKVGKPYYLIDQTGNGLFTRQDGANSGLQPPMWVVKEF